MKSLSRVRLFATPWTVAYQAPLSMVFSRQEYWSGLPFPSPGDLPDLEIELIINHAYILKSLVAQSVKNLPSMQGNTCRISWVQSLGQEDPLEKEMATHSSNLAWEIPWTEEPGGLQSMG